MSVFSSRYFTITGAYRRDARVLAAGPLAHRPGARNHHRAGRDLERAVRLAAVDAVAHQVEHRRAAGEDRAWRQHRALPHDRALVHAAVPAHQHLVLDHDRQRARGLEHAADLRRGREVDPLADLRAGADQRVGVDHRPVVHIRADVHVHRRHAHDAAAEVAPIADRGAAGHDPYAVLGSEGAERVGVLVEEGEGAAGGGRPDLSQAEAEQDARLHPRVGAPASHPRRAPPPAPGRR